ncbi:Periplasmic oligopeptide-binding protein [Lentibacillus sp. JNUCC-1]|uniref:glutathione ABC transporter substrate-binding protein n=1 Tax=Lentibacillus sp. JNUCC-1 TaxID=2654513 RepID=UPI0012E8DBA3|nr:glutathione ABC transporter substrate-binding protein [Lentibacillus sp. JNUCC-1]MUV36799.1 Periplasmic oligopeptide-binding protein [Lentibacillus sp. JNUCC-1]
MKYIKGFFVLFIAAIVLSACAGDGSGNNNSTEPNTSDNGNGGGEDNTLTVDLASDPVSLDPHAANDGNSLYVMNAMYDTLVQMNTDLEIEPGLAESFEQIEDTVWEAKLREGVKFHDGSELNAEVVKANLDRVRDPDIASPLSFLFDMIESVEVEDEYTVHITTKYPFSALPSHLAHPGGHMISMDLIEKSYDALDEGNDPFTVVNENPIGTGYFKYKDRVNGEYVALEKNEDYWGEEAQVDTVTFKTVPEDSARIAELKTGAADIIYPVNANDVEQINNTEGMHVKESDSASMSYLGMNNEKEPFNNVKVRQAIAMAINKDQLIEGVLEGVPLPAKGPLAPTVNGYSEDTEPIEFDQDQAKKLLEEAGYADGFKTSILAYDRTTSDIAENIQAQLSKIGIEAEIEMAEVGAYLEVTGNGSFDMFVGSWGTVTLDADYGLYPMFHSENAGDSGNRSFFKNDEVDSLLEQARKSTDEAERQKLYAEAQQIIVDEATIVPLYHSVLLAGLQDSVDGFFQFPSSFPFLRDVTVE